MMDTIIAAWVIELGIIAVRDLSGNLPAGDPFTRRPPYPWELLSSAIVFGALSVIAQNDTARRPATAVAWGLVVATFLSSQVDFLKPIGSFLSGGYVPGGSPGAPVGSSTASTAVGQIASGNLSAGTGGTPGGRRGQQP